MIKKEVQTYQLGTHLLFLGPVIINIHLYMYRANQRKHTCATFFLDLGSLRRVFGFGIIFLSIFEFGYIDVVTIVYENLCGGER